MSRVSFFHDIFSSVFARSEPLGESSEGGSFAELCDALLAERGETSERRVARGLLARFEAASTEERLGFFELLAERFDIDAEHVERAARRYGESRDAACLERLMDSAQPRRQKLLGQLNEVPDATVRLVRMRESLLGLVEEHPALARIDLDFRHLFRSWFNRGFLVLREIDWNTPANVLEKIIAYEAVHAIGSWAELRARLEPPDRRCFAFFHPAMPDEPLIFVEVALTGATPASVREVIGPEREPLALDAVDTAVFYSISNCQRGLAGVSFGNFLIKQVAAELSRELPQLTTFRTLSPMPGFMRWVERRSAGVAAAPPVGSGGGEGREASPSAAGRPASDDGTASGDTVPSGSAATAGASAADARPAADDGVTTEDLALAREVAESDESPPLDEERRGRLARLVARYLVHAKRDDGQPLDPVARFHLGNGASLDEILPDADPFRAARRRSAGAMVSYLYDLEQVEANNEAFAGERRVVTSGSIDALLAPPRRTRRRS